ncbi:hypothetical protein [Pedobacter sp. R-06]
METEFANQLISLQLNLNQQLNGSSFVPTGSQKSSNKFGGFFV